MKTDWPYPHIVAHRGGGILAPENTLAAIDVAISSGHKMIELDAKLARDGQIFLLHDDTLERTSNGWGIAGQLMWDELSQLDVGSWYGAAYCGESLPLLSAVAARCVKHGLMVNIEIKPTTGAELQTGRAIALATQLLWQGQTILPLLSSFSQVALAEAQRAVPELPRGLLLDKWDESWHELAQRFSCVSLHINYRTLNEQRVALLKAAGLRILAYTVNHPDKAWELLNWGVDCICTDRIDLIAHDFFYTFPALALYFLSKRSLSCCFL